MGLTALPKAAAAVCGKAMTTTPSPLRRSSVVTIVMSTTTSAGNGRMQDDAASSSRQHPQMLLQQQQQQQQQQRSYHVLSNSSTSPFRLQKDQKDTKVFTSSTCRSFSTNKKDFYDLLGVDRKADKGAIKGAYFKLAKQYHPDTNKGDTKAADKFKEVTEAYEVLSDDKQRELYDQFGHAGVDPNFQANAGNPFAGGGFEGFNFGDGSFHFSSSSGPGGNMEIDPEDVFEMFFGGGGGSGRRRQRGPRRGSDLQMHLRVSFQEAVFGAQKDLDLKYEVVDRKTGQRTLKERKVTVDVPAGIDTGISLRLSGQGAEGDPGAPAGNLLVQVIVDSDDHFVRDGYDVHTEVPISVTQAILGGSVDVRTLKGEVEMKIPKGCQPDNKLVLRGRGIQELHGVRKGNQIVHLRIQIPKEISARQEELLRQFDEECDNRGMGITGRIAHAAESAFEKMFGKKKCKDDDKKKETKSSKDASDSDDEEEKKQAAQ